MTYINSCIGLKFDLFTSEAPTCPKIDPPANGSLRPIKDVYQDSDDVIFSCFPGYEIKGWKELLCLDGTWVADPPTCEGEFLRNKVKT